MKTIASFNVNHDLLKKGIYISRIDGDCITYDIRMKIPNNPDNDYLEDNCLHTIEHLFATYARNSQFSDYVIYVGPMGCRTGFYLIVRDSATKDDVIKLTKNSLQYIIDFQGEIPGSKKSQCGNYKAHDLYKAKVVAEDMKNILIDWSPVKMIYPE